MPNKRSYRLLCPIARALDQVGDRWTLLILRDLHAGPAKFGELQTGLTGLASNLLASRLRDLQDSGLIRKTSAGRSQLYELTPDGEATAPLLFELSQYGSRFPAPEDLRRPGNLRLTAVFFKEVLRRASSPNTNQRVELVVDGEPFAISIDAGQVTVAYRPDADAPVSVGMDYSAMMSLADGDMSGEEFATRHVKILRGPVEGLQIFMGLLGRGVAM